jgi:hypothetical protein
LSASSAYALECASLEVHKTRIDQSGFVYIEFSNGKVAKLCDVDAAWTNGNSVSIGSGTCLGWRDFAMTAKQSSRPLTIKTNHTSCTSGTNGSEDTKITEVKLSQ